MIAGIFAPMNNANELAEKVAVTAKERQPQAAPTVAPIILIDHCVQHADGISTVLTFFFYYEKTPY